MDYSKRIERIFENLENDNVEAATMACLRVARASRDHLNAAFFLRELYPSGTEVGRMIYDDMHHLKDAAGKYVFEHSFDRWLEVHTLEFSILSDDDEEEKSVLEVAAGQIDSELEQWELTLTELTPPVGLTPYDAAAFHDSANRHRSRIRLRVNALNTIKSRLKTMCLNYAIQMEIQISTQDKNQEFLWSVENDVNNYFKERKKEVYLKLQKASSLSAASHTEDGALVLTEVRRALKAAADHFYPASSDPVTCSDGKERVLGNDQYLNRLSEYLATKVTASAARELATAELKLLDAFMRRLNDLASKGVHAEVSPAEAKQGLVGAFMFLSTLIHANLSKPTKQF